MPSPVITSFFSGIGSRNDPQIGSTSLSDVAGSQTRSTRALNQIAGRSINDPEELIETVDAPSTTVTEIPPVAPPRDTFQGETNRTAEAENTSPDLFRSISERVGINNILAATTVSQAQEVPTTDPSFRIYIDPKCTGGGDPRIGPFFEMDLLPAVRQNMNHPYGTAGQSVPGAPPGVTMAHIQNVVNIGIPGSAPIQQSLGISMIQFEFVGAFIGTSRITNNMNFQGADTVPADNCDTFHGTGFGGGPRTIPRRELARPSEGDGAWAAAQTFSREVVARGKEVLVEINTRNDLTVQETGIITKFVPMLARNDRVWYKFTLLISDYTDPDFPHIPEDYLDPNMTLNISELGDRPGGITPQAQQRLEQQQVSGPQTQTTPSTSVQLFDPGDPTGGDVVRDVEASAATNAQFTQILDQTEERERAFATGQDDLGNGLSDDLATVEALEADDPDFGSPASARLTAARNRSQRAATDAANRLNGYREDQNNYSAIINEIDSVQEPTPDQLAIRDRAVNGLNTSRAYEQQLRDTLSNEAKLAILDAGFQP